MGRIRRSVSDRTPVDPEKRPQSAGMAGFDVTISLPRPLPEDKDLAVAYLKRLQTRGELLPIADIPGDTLALWMDMLGLNDRQPCSRMAESNRAKLIGADGV